MIASFVLSIVDVDAPVSAGRSVRLIRVISRSARVLRVVFKVYDLGTSAGSTIQAGNADNAVRATGAPAHARS